MDSQDPSKGVSLRKRAEKILSQRPQDLRKIPVEDIKRLIHELDVYQIELDMQNDELRKAQAEIEQSRAKYVDLYDFAPIGYFTFDQKGMILEANLASAKLLDVERSLLLRDPFIRFVSPEFRSTFHLHLERVFSTGTKETCELKLINKGGNSFYVSLESISSKDSEGRSIQCRSAISDITGRKHAEGELQKAHDELEIRVQERTEELVSVNKALEIEITERKQAEEALRQRTFELQELTESLEKRVQERTSELSEAVERLQIEIVQRERLEHTLRESENQVRFFASQCLTAQETERKRIAGELHDSVAASLGAIKFSVEKILGQKEEDESIQRGLRDLITKVQQANEETRRIMADLRPSILDDLGIVPAINWFCREYEKTYSHIRVEKQIDLSESDVTDSLKTAIFRVSQEAMNNIAKHSKASLVSLYLQKENGKIELTIQDNGQGFNLDTARRGLGLSSMRERTELSGGTFDFESIIGKGTVIRVSWPLT